MRSQNATATLGTTQTCPPDTVDIPLAVTNFMDVGAMTFEIGYDTNDLEFITLFNVNPVIPGGILFNASGGVVAISWSSLAPFNLSNGTLFDLKFNYVQDSSALTFDFIEIANSQLDILEVETTPGGVDHQITITDQPDSVQVYPESNVNFLILSSGNDFYQWQEDSGSGWTDLTNTGPYSGANTNLLTITSVPLNFNGNIYRCVLFTNEDCIMYSDPALLTVAESFPIVALEDIDACPQTDVTMPVEVDDFNSVSSFVFNVAYEAEVMDFTSLENIHPLLQNGNLITDPLVGENGIAILWTTPTPVNFGATTLFDMVFDYHMDTTMVNFGDGTEVINSFGNPMLLTLTDGSVKQQEIPVIVLQPFNDTVNSGENASFLIEVQNAAAYQWQVSTNNGMNWSDLVNQPPYSQVNLPELQITEAYTYLSGNMYRCLVSGDFCNKYSNFARLIVDSTTRVNSIDISDIIKVYPNPTTGPITLTGEFEEMLILIHDLSGKVAGELRLDGGSRTGTLEGLPEGMWLLEMRAIIRGEVRTGYKKVVKLSNN